MKRLLVLGLLITAVYACNDAGKNYTYEEVEIDSTITIESSFNNLFLDSAAIERYIATDSSASKYRAELLAFYTSRNFEYAWFDSNGVSEQAHNFLNLARTTAITQNDSTWINSSLEASIQQASTLGKTKKDLESNEFKVLSTKAEIALTKYFFTYASKVFNGAEVDVTQLGWFIPRKKIDVTNVLDSVLKTKSADAVINSLQSKQYILLQGFLEKFIRLRKQYNWDTDTIPSPAKPYKLGDSSHAIEAIKQRLFAYGDYSTDYFSPLYNDTLFTAVKRFQRRNGLVVDGAIGKKMVAQLNDSIDTKIRTLLINIERARWMPKIDDSVYILVNIPEYKLHVFKYDTLYHTMNVIVGSEANNTVIFSGNLRYVVFSPYWNVPYSIVKKEIAPKLVNDPGYLARNNYEIYGAKVGGLPQIRQKPGDNNALGHVKFLFPNTYNIYLHDTPNRNLFTSHKRNLSHGCVRVGEPKWLAQFLLRNHPVYTDSLISASMGLTKEKWVTLQEPVKVVITYFTAFVDASGTLNFRKDIYGHDKKMAEKLFGK